MTTIANCVSQTAMRWHVACVLAEQVDHQVPRKPQITNAMAPLDGFVMIDKAVAEFRCLGPRDLGTLYASSTSAVTLVTLRIPIEAADTPKVEAKSQASLGN
ncbi:hypothetical protein E4U55_007564 [Claviceps digitariae]|nr:hypothetical protein E4U55_007564 [Claviceps digitariae]